MVQGYSQSWIICEVLVQIISHLLFMLQSKSAHSQRAVTLNQFLGTRTKLMSGQKIFVLQIIFSLPWCSFGMYFTERAHLVNWYARPWRINIQRSNLRLTSYRGKKPRPNHTLVLSFNKYMLIECFWSMTLNKGQGLVHVPR